MQIYNLKNKENVSLYNLYSKIILKVIFCILVITIYNVILLFIAPPMFNFFKFLL